MESPDGITVTFPDCECVLRNCPALWDAVNRT